MFRHATFVGVVAALALAAPASAAPGDGAEHIHNASCMENAFGVLCIEEDILTNSTQNSNVIEFFIHTEGSTTFTGAAGGQAEGCSQTQQYRTKSHSLFKTDEFDPQVQAIKGETVTIVVNCFGSSLICTFTNAYHYANGKLQYDRTRGSCEPQ
jgi:hypothetical protein